jgi:hypothetical protein
LGRLGDVAHNRGYPIRRQGYRLEIHPRVRIRLGMIRIGYSRIQIRMSLFTTLYLEFGYEYYRIRMQNGYFEFGFAFEYLLDL